LQLDENPELGGLSRIIPGLEYRFETIELIDRRRIE